MEEGQRKTIYRSIVGNFWSFVNPTDAPEVMIPYEQMGFLHTKEDWEEVKRGVDLFFDTYMSPEEVKAYNYEKLNPAPHDKPRENEPTETVRAKKPGFVYLARSESGYFKIGISKHPQKRIEQLNNGPLEVVLLHTFHADNAIVAEEVLHSYFSEKKVKGEWFNLSREDVDWLCCIEGYDDGTFHANS
jgi:predicted GIY-YIG superfamily endonuclease